MSQAQEHLPSSMTALTIRLDDELFAVEAPNAAKPPRAALGDLV